MALVLALLVVAAVVAWWLVPSGPPGPPPASVGLVMDRAVPDAVLDAPLLDQTGRSVTLRSLPGRNLVLVPFLTSCQEVCPLTTAALLEVQRSLAAAGVGHSVTIVELSIDPERDVPGRLAAYARLTGARWPLLTGSPSTIEAVWHDLGVYVQKVPEGTPPGIDWQTGAPYTYDVNHTDGFILLGPAPARHERFVTIAPPDVRHSALPPALGAMLDDEGRSNYRAPGAGAWTVPQALSAIGWLAGVSIPVHQ